MDKSVVEIDQKEMEDYAKCFGLLCRVCEDNLPEETVPYERSFVPAFCACFMARGLFASHEGFNAFVSSSIEVTAQRCMLKNHKQRVDFPEWDPEDHHEEDCRPLADVFFCFYAHKLFASGAVELPEESLGAIFTLSGLALEGIAKGYHLTDEDVKKAYPQFEESLNKAFSSEGGMKVNLPNSLKDLATIAALQKMASAPLNL